MPVEIFQDCIDIHVFRGINGHGLSINIAVICPCLMFRELALSGPD